MNADGLQTFVGGISREEGHKHMLENSYLESLSCLCQNGGKKKKDCVNSLLTWWLVVSITRAFGTNNAVLVFLMNVTDATGIEIWRCENHVIPCYTREFSHETWTVTELKGGCFFCFFKSKLQYDTSTLVSLPKTLEWKQIQLSDRNILPWYKMSLCRAQV